MVTICRNRKWLILWKDWERQTQQIFEDNFHVICENVYKYFARDQKCKKKKSLTNENSPFLSSNKCHSQKFPIKSRIHLIPHGKHHLSIGKFSHSERFFLYVTTSDTHSTLLCMRRVQVDKIVMEIVKKIYFPSQIERGKCDPCWEWINWTQFLDKKIK